jgi:hypothetical protein
MTLAERERIFELCMRIAIERDSKTFDRLVDELRELLELESEGVRPRRTAKPS